MTIKQLASLFPHEIPVGPIQYVNGMIIVDYVDDTYYRRPTCDDNPFFNAQLLLTYEKS